MMSIAMRLAIDSHVHLHDRAIAREALSAAVTRLANGANPNQIGVVMLAERRGYSVFETLRPQLVATQDPEALWLDDDRRLLVLAGRQIISAEKLEILALATTATLTDGLPAEQIIEQMNLADAIVVLPWGVGKWIGKRGALVDRLIADAKPGRLFLGDNGGRPRFWPVRQFDTGLPVLSGSDPLPLPGWPEAIGSFGSLIETELAPDRPASSLKRSLRDPNLCIGRHGILATPMRFLFDQTRLRLAGRDALQ